jgi:hypothetical protein
LTGCNGGDRLWGMTNSKTTHQTAWQQMSPDERAAHSKRMREMAAASRLRFRCVHGVGRPDVCYRCDADERDAYRKGAL